MALTFQIAGNPDAQFIGKVKTAFMKACPAIQNEAVNTANHAQRLTLVDRILANPDGYAQRCATMVALDGTLYANNNSLSTATDSQIENGVNGILDMLALRGV